MQKTNRDLLVMFNQEMMTPQAIEQQVTLLHNLLFGVERIDNIILAHELIDLNKYKIIRSQSAIKNWIRKRKNPPFIFLNNLN
jgi:hypothetical protein